MPYINFRVSDSEKENLENAARVAECTVTDIIRDALTRCGFRMDPPVINVMTPPGQHAMLVPSPDGSPGKEENQHVD